jgi:hypothetical protein
MTALDTNILIYLATRPIPSGSKWRSISSPAPAMADARGRLTDYLALFPL